MAEIETTIPVGPGLMLQALLETHTSSTERNPSYAVICHPHPLFGGSMHNNVVEATQRTLAKQGHNTIRFNFRGVGSSGGRHGHGIAEIDDVKAVFGFATDNGTTEVHLVGYSFGAWVGVKAVNDGLEPTTLTLISPPVDVLDFDGIGLPNIPCLVVTGEFDDYASPKSVESWLGKRNGDVSYSVLPQTDHFYVGRENLLATELESFFVAD